MWRCSMDDCSCCAPEKSCDESVTCQGIRGPETWIYTCVCAKDYSRLGNDCVPSDTCNEQSGTEDDASAPKPPTQPKAGVATALVKNLAKTGGLLGALTKLLESFRAILATVNNWGIYY